MKKFFFLMLLVASTGIIRAYDFQVDSFCFNIITNQTNAVEVTYDWTSGTNYPNLTIANIPAIVTCQGINYSVTSIGDSAFYGCHGLTSITIPNSVTSIGNCAFYNCSSLISIIIPNSVTSIGRSAFSDCSGLTSIAIPNNLTSIGYYAFRNCTGLTSITIPNSVTSIRGYAFSGCYLLELNYGGSASGYPWGATIVDERTQDGLIIINNCIVTCVSNDSIVSVPNGVTRIGSDAFYNCKSLTYITIPNSVTWIGTEAFTNCSGLTSITIPNSVTGIGGNAFSGCSGLTLITIPNSVTSIGGNAFLGCYFIELNYGGSASGYPWGATIVDERTQDGFIIKENSLMKYIGNDAIVTIPDGVTSIGSYAFAGRSSLTSVSVPNSITNIGSYAFENCSSLTSVVIPNSVTSIGNQAFRGCSGLMSITCEATIPPALGSNVFPNYNIPCYVPMESFIYYRIANQWQNFGTNIQGYYLVIFQDWDGTELSKDHVTAGASAVGPTKEPTREGYVFIGWDSDLDSITSDLVVTAQYTIFYPVIFLDWKGIVLLRDTIAQDSAATAPAAPVREGYEFIGWSQDFSNIQGELYVIAQYEKVPEPVEGILVTYTDGVDNAVIDNDTIVLNIPEAPIHSGYTFLSWMTVVGNPEDGITIKAIYQEDSPTNVQQESAVPQSDESRKIFENGNVYILRDGKTYTLQGQEVK